MAESAHFTTREFACKDGCGWSEPNPRLLARLEALRERLKRPIHIVSGCRCCPHNSKVGGASRSQHIYGRAADIPASLGVTVKMAKDCGFTGIGTRQGKVVHVDVRPVRGAPVTWEY